MLSCHHAMPCIVISLCSVMNCDHHTMPCIVILQYCNSWHYCHIIMACHVLSCHGMFRHAIIPCHVLSCHHTMSCIVMSSHHVMSQEVPGAGARLHRGPEHRAAPRRADVCQPSVLLLLSRQGGGWTCLIIMTVLMLIGLKYTFTCLSKAWQKIQNRG